MILMIDNYDSFTYNLVQYFGELGADLQVYRNDKITISGVEGLQPEKIVISPGPCTPNEANCLELTAWTDQDEIMGVQHTDLPIFGVQFHPESILTPEGKKLLDNFLQL